MGLVNMNNMLASARAKGYAIGAFEYWSLDSALAVTLTAKEQDTPVILQVGHLERDYMYGYPNAYKLATIAAEQANIDVALHLDHAEDYLEVQKALDAGFTSVMIDGSMLPLAENIELTTKVVRLAENYGASVEAELGRLGGIEGNINGKEALTCPEEATTFAKETGIDALAIAIGSAHGLYKSTPKIDIDRLMQIADLVSIPLVLHGGSGIPSSQIISAIKSGIAKINICTEFVTAYGKKFASLQLEPNFTYNVASLFARAHMSAKELVRQKIALFSLLKE